MKKKLISMFLTTALLTGGVIGIAIASENNQDSFSINGYTGIPNQIEYLGDFSTPSMMGSDRLDVAIVGGTPYHGIGKLNTRFPDEKPFYLINIDFEEGEYSQHFDTGLLMDWTTEFFPDELREKFDVVVLEQIEPKNLIKTQDFKNL